MDTVFTLGWALVPILDFSAGYYNKTHYTDMAGVDADNLKYTWWTEMIGSSVMLTTWATGVFLKSKITEELFTITSRLQVFYTIAQIYANWYFIDNSVYQYQVPGATKGVYAVHLTALLITLNAPIRIAGFYETRALEAEEADAEVVDETPVEVTDPTYETAL